jgi:hypothetical protein
MRKRPIDKLRFEKIWGINAGTIDERDAASASHCGEIRYMHMHSAESVILKRKSKIKRVHATFYEIIECTRVHQKCESSEISLRFVLNLTEIYDSKFQTCKIR